MSAADDLRRLADPAFPAAALAGAEALDLLPRLEATISGLEETVADLRRQLEQATPKPGYSTLFGINNAGKASTADTIARFGSAQAVKLFDGGSGRFPDVAGAVPAKRGQACFKGNMSDLAAGRRNAELEAYIVDQQRRGVRLLLITPWQEPNGELKDGSLPLDVYLAGCRQVAKVVQAVGQPGVTMLAQTFTADQPRNGVDVPDAWILPPDQAGGIEWARLCLDNYGNPAGAKNYGGDPYATPYPTPEQVSGSAWAQVQRTGWELSYGISEWNYPWRRNLPDPDHTERLAAMRAHVAWWLARPTPPKHMFLWHGDGNQFDQKLYTQAEVEFWAARMATTP